VIFKSLNDVELEKHLDSIHKDEMAVFVMAEGRVRGALFNGSRFVNQARAQHQLGILETMVFGQAALCGALLLPTMKGKEHKTWHYEVDGPAKGFSIETDSTGYVRGYLYENHIPVEKPLESWDLTPFLGNGTITMSTLREFDKEPYSSSVDVDSKNIARDLAWFFNQSEQIQTAFNTGIQMDKQGRVIGAGGMFLQVLPEVGGFKKSGEAVNSQADRKADEELIEKVELAFRSAPSLGQWFAENGSIEDLVYGLFREFKPAIAVRRDVKFDCPCSKEVYLNHVRHLPASEIEDIKKSGQDSIEIVCRNCSSVYNIPVSEL